MDLELRTLAQSLNVAYLKQSLSEQQINLFKAELKKTFLHYNEAETEEYHKNLISDFLKNVYYKDQYLVNVNKRNDLVIRHGYTINHNIGVILEFKKPTEKTDMVGKENANVKALHELVLYYLRETVDNNKHDIKYLIATSINEWFVFDELWFEKNIYKNTQLIKDYTNYKTSGHNTEHFYKLIAAKHLADIDDKLVCTYFNLNDYKAILDSTNEEDNNSLIALYKILSPQHLLKKPFANDSNTLNKEFYDELLHIVGLEECKDGGKRIIIQKAKDNRDEGSLIENTINILKTQKKCGYATDAETENLYFEVALELCILWLNRILFLKLLEGQLINYHRGDKTNYSFLTTDTNNGIYIKDFHELYELFFDVLAVHPTLRATSIIQKYKNLPYLNSSLFELSDFEIQYTAINQLKSRLDMPIYAHTVLKNANGKPIVGKKQTLPYLFEFLDAYDFATEGIAKIQKQSKTLINASVLGLIFEKINGYKDGSFFTPGFITMYMCRATITKVVLQRFNTLKQWDCQNLADLKNKIDYTNPQERDQANAIINSIKICDPAVGSGHFLVSALNELIAIKSELKILNYRNGGRIKEWQIEIENDEIIIRSVEDNFLLSYCLNKYNKGYGELQSMQETLFHEKQIIIENCLFGVDINPKSVSICRLRLWIELLKNAYYTQDSQFEQLETLPNIDINIKCGNSLVSRFAINDKNNLLPKDRIYVKQLIEKYKVIVDGYKNAIDYRAKSDYRRQIGYIKTEFEKFTFNKDKDYHLLAKKEKELTTKQSEIPFGNAEERKVWETAINTLATEVTEIKTLYENKLKTLYANAIEWRFEFPEVLDSEGIFVGFDIVIGNPPYIRQEKIKQVFKEYYLNQFAGIGNSTADIYVYFFGLAISICKPDSYIGFITLNKWLKTMYGNNLRAVLAELKVESIIDFFELPVFEVAATDSAITLLQNTVVNFATKYFPIKSLKHLNLIETVSSNTYLGVEKNNTEWSFTNISVNSIINKLTFQTTMLKDFVGNKMFMGIKTGLNKVFIVSNKIKQDICDIDPKSVSIFKQYVLPTKLTTYQITGEPEWFINTHNGILIDKKEFETLSELVAGKEFLNWDGEKIEVYRKEVSSKNKIRINRIIAEIDYPALYAYLLKHKEKLETRGDKGEHWSNLRNCDYIYQFGKPKLIYVYTAKQHPFYFDTDGMFINNSSYMIVSHNCFLWAFLNSNLFKWYQKIKFVAYGDADEGGRVKLDFNKMETLPIKIINEAQQADFDTVVNNLLLIKKNKPNTDVTELENKLNRLIYKLYQLTESEIAIIEGISEVN